MSYPHTRSRFSEIIELKLKDFEDHSQSYSLIFWLKVSLVNRTALALRSRLNANSVE
jgi:hypothetical protein